MISIVDLTTRDRDDGTDTLAESICKAFSDVGFVYLKNHGIPESLVSEFFSISKSFFDLPVETKQRFKIPDGDFYGWMGLAEERLNPAGGEEDIKESYNFNPRIGEQASPTSVIPSFFPVYQNFFRACKELAYRIMDLMCVGLHLEKDFFRERHQLIGKYGNLTSLRSLYYPPIVSEVKPGQIRCGQHTDYGTVTLLFQDDVGGLEVKSTGPDFIPAKCIPNTVLVNLGALMQRWTSDKLVATEHRVIIPEEEISRKQGRQSVAFFLQPDDQVVVECIDNSNKYEPISAWNYLNMRFAETY